MLTLWATSRPRYVVLQLIDERIDVLVITETWHENSDTSTLKNVMPPGYQCIDAARSIQPGAAVHTVDFQNHGGSAFIFLDTICFRKTTFGISVTTFEYLCGLATTSDGHFVVLGIYRPGSVGVSAAFYDELSAIFERLAMYSCPIVICGDFNIHVDQSDDSYALRLRQLLQSFGLVQHVNEQTHSVGHTLDLVKSDRRRNHYTTKPLQWFIHLRAQRL